VATCQRYTASTTETLIRFINHWITIFPIHLQLSGPTRETIHFTQTPKPPNPQTLKPSNPQTLKPSNPQTLKPSNPQTLKPPNPQANLDFQETKPTSEFRRSLRFSTPFIPVHASIFDIPVFPSDRKRSVVNRHIIKLNTRPKRQVNRQLFRKSNIFLKLEKRQMYQSCKLKLISLTANPA
jgi:hypothetical protein